MSWAPRASRRVRGSRGSGPPHCLPRASRADPDDVETSIVENGPPSPDPLIVELPSRPGAAPRPAGLPPGGRVGGGALRTGIPPAAPVSPVRRTGLLPHGDRLRAGGCDRSALASPSHHHPQVRPPVSSRPHREGLTSGTTLGSPWSLSPRGPPAPALPRTRSGGCSSSSAVPSGSPARWCRSLRVQVFLPPTS